MTRCGDDDSSSALVVMAMPRVTTQKSNISVYGFIEVLKAFHFKQAILICLPEIDPVHDGIQGCFYYDRQVVGSYNIFHFWYILPCDILSNGF